VDCLAVAKKSEKRIKTKLIGVRATPSEYDQFKAVADSFGVSVGELCRSASFNLVLKSKTDLEAIGNLAACRADLGRLGGLLKGWLADTFPNAPTPDRQRVIALLNEINAAKNVMVDSAQKLMTKDQS
jgi:hypothetical protein